MFTTAMKRTLTAVALVKQSVSPDWLVVHRVIARLRCVTRLQAHAPAPAAKMVSGTETKRMLTAVVHVVRPALLAAIVPLLATACPRCATRLPAHVPPQAATMVSATVTKRMSTAVARVERHAPLVSTVPLLATARPRCVTRPPACAPLPLATMASSTATKQTSTVVARAVRHAPLVSTVQMDATAGHMSAKELSVSLRRVVMAFTTATRVTWIAVVAAPSVAHEWHAKLLLTVTQACAVHKMVSSSLVAKCLRVRTV